jgi:hypothetical protein
VVRAQNEVTRSMFKGGTESKRPVTASPYSCRRDPRLKGSLETLGLKCSGLFAQQAHQSQQLVPAGIGDGAILDIALLPEREVVAAARRITG